MLHLLLLTSCMEFLGMSPNLAKLYHVLNLCRGSVRLQMCMGLLARVYDCMQGPAVSGRDSDAVPGVGLVSDSADSMDVSRRQSVRYTISVFAYCMKYMCDLSALSCHD